MTSIIISKYIKTEANPIGIRPHTGFAFALGFASDVKEEALERCEGQVGNTLPLFLPRSLIVTIQAIPKSWEDFSRIRTSFKGKFPGVWD